MDNVSPKRAGVPRAAAIFGLWVLAPMWLAMVLGLLKLDGFAIVLLLPWKYIVYPHDWAVVAEAGGYQRVFPGSAAEYAAILQWVCAAAVYAGLTARLRTRTHVWLAPLVIGVVGIALLLIAAVFGIQVAGGWM